VRGGFAFGTGRAEVTTDLGLCIVLFAPAAYLGT